MRNNKITLHSSMNRRRVKKHIPINLAPPSTHLQSLRLAVLGLAVFGFGLTARVYGDILVDGDFEAAAPGALTGLTTFFTIGNSIDGGSWTVSQGNVGVDTQNLFVYAGNNSVFLNRLGGGPGSLMQTLTTEAGQTYAVSFWANADVSNTFSVTLGGVAVTGAPTSIAVNGFPSNNYLGNSGAFTYYSGIAAATSASSDLVFTATALSTAGTDQTVEIDNVSVSVVPEPSTFALTAVGAIGGIACCLRRRS